MPHWANGFRRRPSAAMAIAMFLLLLIFMRLAPRGGQPPSALPEEFVRVKRVVDGDTLLLETGERVRLIGVNTPETKHPDRPPEPLGPEAAVFTRSLVEGKRVRLEFDRERRDEYHRILAYVFIDDQMLNELIIRQGFSRAVTRFPYRADRKRLFEDAEDDAERNKRGLWAVPQSRPSPSGETGSAAERRRAAA
jgi:micrococcal nuclease